MLASVEDAEDSVVRDYRRFPARVEVLKELGASEGGPDGVHAGFLLRLVVDVFAVADLVRLIPVPPRSCRYAMAVRKRFGENFFLRHVFEAPIHVTGQVIPL